MYTDKTYPDAVEVVLELMRDTFGTYFKQYYNGDPYEIPKNNLPCIIVEQPKSNVRLDATTTDRLGSEIRLSLLMNQADDRNAPEGTDLTEKKLRDLVQGRSIDGKYIPNTVYGALRTKITLGSYTLEQNIDVTYGPQPRPKTLVTNEARISIILRERVIVPDRT